MKKKLFPFFAVLIAFSIACAENTKKESLPDAKNSASEEAAAVSSNTAIKTAAVSVPRAADLNPRNVITFINKEEYFAAVDKAWTDGPSKGIFAIPAMGVMFKKGKSDIVHYYREMLDEFAYLYLETDGNAAVLVEGYSSTSDNETANNPQLSRQRALNVAAYLKKKGIPADKIEKSAYGDKKIASKIFAKDKQCKVVSCYLRVNVRIK